MLVRNEGAVIAAQFFAGIAGVFAALLGGYGAWLKSRANATVRWRPIQGAIIQAGLDSRTRRGKNFNEWEEYRADIQYSYTVDGKDYVGKRVYFGAHEWRKRDPSVAEELISRYRQHGPLRVFVDPARPAQSVLERGRGQVARHYLQGATFVGGAGLLAFFLSLVLAR